MIEAGNRSTTTNSLIDLGFKVAAELGNPMQFADGKRIRGLTTHAMAHINGILKPIEHDVRALEKDISRDSKFVINTDGVEACIVPTLPLIVVTFPFRTKIDYLSPFDFPKIPAEAKIGVVPTTYAIGLPSEGFKDSEGEHMRFIPRADDAQVQHGGILTEAEKKGLDILNYQQMMVEKDKDLQVGEALIQANWYMDQHNQAAIYDLQSQSGRHPYNAIGIFDIDGEKRHFTVNNDGDSIGSLLEYFGVGVRMDVRNIALREIAVVCNLLAERYSASSWRIAGTEYHNGGTYPFMAKNRAAFAARDFFAYSY